MKQVIVMALLFCIFLCEGCKEEDYVYPSVVTEFIGAQTNNDGTISQLVADDGTIYSVLQRDGLGGLVADTLYRTIFTNLSHKKMAREVLPNYIHANLYCR